MAKGVECEYTKSVIKIGFDTDYVNVKTVIHRNLSADMIVGMGQEGLQLIYFFLIACLILG